MHSIRSSQFYYSSWPFFLANIISKFDITSQLKTGRIELCVHIYVSGIGPQSVTESLLELFKNSKPFALAPFVFLFVFLRQSNGF